MLCMIIGLTMITMIMIPGGPDKTADDHHPYRQPDSHCLQHHDRATHQPDASLMIQIDHDIQR